MLSVPVYMDYNATTPCDVRVVEAMLPYFTQQFGNAASHTHRYGWAAKEAVDLGREQIAGLIHSEPGEIIFTSGATEAINLAIKGVFELYHKKGNHIITCVTEHKAVLDTCGALERRGAEITYLPVNKDGSINLTQLKDAITPRTILLALMFANNETGYIHPIREISKIAHEKNTYLFCDATQAVGKVPVDVKEYAIDMMSFSGHKLYGPKGIGALYLSRKDPRMRVQPQMDGGGHEKGFRSGTLNVPAIVGMGVAAQICGQEMKHDQQRVGALRDRLEQAMLKTGKVSVNGSKTSRLPNTANLAFKGVDGARLITEVTKKIAVSTGSACTSALPEPSHVLSAMGLAENLARASLRFSLGRLTTEQEVQFAVDAIDDMLEDL